jgi:beta-1,4-N-acetylglucosaminyltransferase
MIFVTIGTSEPFDRLLRALDGLVDDEEMIVQCGASSSRPPGAECVEFLSFEKFVEHVRAARVVVMHAGAGSVLTALANGRRPVVVPRLKRFGEAVDDHQVAFAKRLELEGLVTLVEEPRRLAGVLPDLRNGAGCAITADGPLVRELRAFLISRTNGARA